MPDIPRGTTLCPDPDCPYPRGECYGDPLDFATYDELTEPDECVVCGSLEPMTWVEVDKAWECDECFHAHVEASPFKEKAHAEEKEI